MTKSEHYNLFGEEQKLTEMDRDSIEDMETEQEGMPGLTRFASKPRPDEKYLAFNNSQINSSVIDEQNKGVIEDAESENGLGGDIDNSLNESVTSNFELMKDEDDHIK